MDKESRKTSVVKILFYNVLIFFVAANILYWSIPAISHSLRIIAAVSDAIKTRPANSLGETLAWIATRSSDSIWRPGIYRSYVGWRDVPRASEGVNVEGRYLQRRTLNNPASGEPKIYFFGGSTMWGTGVDDASTIPSLFAARTGIHSENFGEAGYVAHQNLALLILLLQAGHRPDLVVFYDGVNDAWHKCRAELTPQSHEREQQFNTAIRSSALRDSFSHYFAPVMAAAENISTELRRASRRAHYNCHAEQAKAKQIAENMIRDWQFAKHLVEWHGGRFIGLLRPLAQFSRTVLDQVEDERLEQLGPQFQAVYPMLREAVARIGGDFHDLVSVLDVNEPVYLDFCHLSAAGNRRVAGKIAEIFRPLVPAAGADQ